MHAVGEAALFELHHSPRWFLRTRRGKSQVLGPRQIFGGWLRKWVGADPYNASCKRLRPGGYPVAPELFWSGEFNPKLLENQQTCPCELW